MIQSKFFKAEPLYDGAWRISNSFDSKARMQTYAYLVGGSEKAVLIDTMFGYGNIKSFCRELTDKPLILVNTHYHRDHTGGNYDFDLFYMHPKDVPLLFSSYDPLHYDVEKKYRDMIDAALPENKDKILPTDVSIPKRSYILPIWGGDIIDLGGRKLEVIHVGGHTPGEIVLLDRDARIAFTGDACNANTLLSGPESLCIEEYLEFLHHFKGFQDAFDHCHGGHEDFSTSIIDEGIELCERIIARTDDKEQRENLTGMAHYGAAHDDDGKGKKRQDGKSCNIAYSPDNIYKKTKAPRIL